MGFTSFSNPTVFAPTGLPGATAPSRYAGATASGHPLTGTFAVGDYVIDETGSIWVCTAAGTPGTWAQIGGASEFTNPMTTLGDIITGGAAGAAQRLGIGATNQVLTVVAGAPAWATQVYGGIFGTGTDGAITFDGVTTPVAGATLAGSTYTMTRDIQATSVVVSAGVTLKTANFKVFCRGTITVNATGTIDSSGSNAAGSAGGTGNGSASGSLTSGRTGGAGGTGVNGAGGNGVASAYGSPSGAGGAGTAGAAGTAATPTVTTLTAAGNNFLLTPQTLVVNATTFGGTGATSPSNVGSSGGGGGADAAANAGGGGGGGAGVIALFAWSVVNNGTISAKGGNGANGAAGNAGGGGGGSGGLIAAYTLSAWTAGTTNVVAGTHGNGSGTGANGNDGGAGLVLNVVVG